MRVDTVLAEAMAICPLAAILRGVTPDEIVAIVDVLVDEGFALIEVPLNSPDALASIALIARRYSPQIVIGAGTVLSVEQVQQVAGAGGRLIVAPNTNVDVIAATAKFNMISLPGYFTPSEAFAAISAGASGLKLFPAEAATPAVLKAQRAVLPRELPIFVVGGVTVDTMAGWLEAGAQGFGLGSGLYSPGTSAATVRARASQFIAGLRVGRPGR